MFIDEVKIQVTGGRGGDGCNSMRREKYIPLGGPDGGNGGHGGNVVFVSRPDQNTLIAFTRKRHFRADGGKNGSRNDRTGRSAQDHEVVVPTGTIVKDEDGAVLADLLTPGDRFVAAQGGRGGRGNASLCTKNNPLPGFAEKGEPGQERWIHLELKLLADVGLVGYPNAGKSSTIRKVSHARPKVADYPFTTVEPSLGVVAVDHATSFVLADIPGLVEGAHDGKGLGMRFLRHVERCRLILHVVDMASVEGRDPVADYRAIRKELKAHSPRLASKPELVVANKMDLPGAASQLAAFRKKVRQKVFPISAMTGEGLKDLVYATSAKLKELGPIEIREEVVHRLVAEVQFRVDRVDEGQFAVTGPQVDRMVAMTNLDNDEALQDFAVKLRKMGLEAELRRAGARPGDNVKIGPVEITYDPD